VRQETTTEAGLKREAGKKTQAGERMVELTIDDREVRAPEGANLVDTAREHGIDIPTLCYLKGVSEPGCCRVCVVEVEGARTLPAACVTPVREGMVVRTNTPRVRRTRRRVVELLLTEHHAECPVCPRAQTCELRAVAARVGLNRLRLPNRRRRRQLLAENPFMVRDPDKCIKCRRCIEVCRKVQGVDAVGAAGRGFDTVIGPAFGDDSVGAACVSCGQCLMSCPTGALTEREHIHEAWKAIDDPDRQVVVQTAPAIQVTLGEEFGMPAGTVVTGKMVAALRRIGFDTVFSTEFAADLTIVEEAHELLERLEGKGDLPLISSCSPGWVKFCEHYYPEFLDNLSTCKSPQEMLGALVKSYYAEKEGLDPARLVTVAVMPCTAKKFEAARPELVSREGRRDVDFVLTTREVARMIRQAGIDLETLEDEEFDQPLGIATGAGVIFAATGGVMEAAVRTAYALTEGEEMARADFHAVRGLNGVRVAEVHLRGRTLKLAVAHGTRNARRLMEQIKAGAEYHFLEIMGCPGGCIGGGGQPIAGAGRREPAQEYRRKRAEALYSIDLKRELRRAHENPAVRKLYDEYLGHPLSEKAKELLHTTYTPRGRYPKGRAENTARLH